MLPMFYDRRDAGKHLAERLAEYAGRPDTLVLALPRGGVPVGFEVAQAIHAPLDVFIVRKLGVPGHEELAMGAIASGGVVVLNRAVIEGLHIQQSTLDAVIAAEEQELGRREQLYRGERPSPEVQGKVAILVDDGLATGSTMRAAAAALRKQGPAEIVVGVPVAAHETCQEFTSSAYADRIVCAATPEPFLAVGMWYADFSPTGDQEVRHLLRASLEESRQPRVGPGTWTAQSGSM